LCNTSSDTLLGLLNAKCSNARSKKKIFIERCGRFVIVSNGASQAMSLAFSAKQIVCRNTFC
jgi:hypothetical protein